MPSVSMTIVELSKFEKGYERMSKAVALRLRVAGQPDIRQSIPFVMHNNADVTYLLQTAIN